MKKVLLIVLDGWGHSTFGTVPQVGNAVELARVPHFREIHAGCPRTRLACSGLDVGLPAGLMGNSEVGHLNLGAGRIVPQDIVRIDRAFADGTISQRLDLAGLSHRVRHRRGCLHLVGLVSDGGVHSHVRHMIGLLQTLSVDVSVRIHAVTDGRDASPTGSADHVEAVEEACSRLPDARVATVMGRYWAMDRDRRWERTKLAWDALTGNFASEVGRFAASRRGGPDEGAARGLSASPAASPVGCSSGGSEESFSGGLTASSEGSRSGSPAASSVGGPDGSPARGLQASRAASRGTRPRRPGVAQRSPAATLLRREYAKGQSDEFLKPLLIDPEGVIGPRDTVLLLNFRADRMRQLTSALSLDGFLGFERRGARPAEVVSMTEYQPDLPVSVAFPPRVVKDGLGEVISRAGYRQLRVAETEKYAHVTYFFNGGREEIFPGEVRELLPSPKVATYDLMPGMSALEVTAAAKRGIDGDYSFVLVNFANPDMVGHTGSLTAAVAAVETVDQCLGDLLHKVRSVPGWVALVTADHGNCEEMIAPDGSPHTAHTTEPVDFIVCDPEGGTLATRTRTGQAITRPHRLADVAPTVLGYLGLDQPRAMTGRDLVAR